MSMERKFCMIWCESGPASAAFRAGINVFWFWLAASMEACKH